MNDATHAAVNGDARAGEVGQTRVSRGPEKHASSARQTDRLDLHAERGVWAIESSSETVVYYLDADALAVLRRTETVPAPAQTDNRWVSLVSVVGYFVREEGVVRAGDRHRYMYDFDLDCTDYRWWIQSTVTAIHRVADRTLGTLPPRKGRGAR
jgi:hypothetical protein